MLPYFFVPKYNNVASINAYYGAAVTLFLMTLFALGAFRGKITGKQWWLTGLQMLVNGAITTVLSYAIGTLLERVLH